MGLNLITLLHASVKKFPHAEAVVSDTRRVTYSDLWEQIVRVGNFLRCQGVKPGDRVALILENSPEYIVAYYSILYAGGVVVALNVAAKTRDFANWINHCGASWLFIDENNEEIRNLAGLLQGKVRTVLTGSSGESFDSSHMYKWSTLIEYEDTNFYTPGCKIDNSPAAIIYTSGTTGNPKGVTISHHNLYANISSIIDYLKLRNDDKAVNVLPFYYSYGNSVLHTHLSVGGCIVLENSMLYPNRVIERIVKEKATGFAGVPSTYALLLSRINLHSYDLSSIRYMTQAGGPMAPAHIERLRKEVPGMDFFVMYGQTEATARLTYLPPEMLDAKLGSIGLAIPGVRIEIRNSSGNLSKPGETGEIYAQGNNIMVGYWDDPEGTKSVLIDGWLKTGDLAHYDEDGYIYIDGRATDIIKSGAYRVSPKEIEEVIQELDEVQEVAVLGVPDEILGEAIKAVIVRKPNTDIKAKAIQRHCRNNIAIYKIPKTIEFLDHLPRTASGKIQKYLLK